jgi:hypothetical protein
LQPQPHPQPQQDPKKVLDYDYQEPKRWVDPEEELAKSFDYYTDDTDYSFMEKHGDKTNVKQKAESDSQGFAHNGRKDEAPGKENKKEDQNTMMTVDNQGNVVDQEEEQRNQQGHALN